MRTVVTALAISAAMGVGTASATQEWCGAEKDLHRQGVYAFLEWGRHHGSVRAQREVNRWYTWKRQLAELKDYDDGVGKDLVRAQEDFLDFTVSLTTALAFDYGLACRAGALRKVAEALGTILGGNKGHLKTTKEVKKLHQFLLNDVTTLENVLKK